jgi:hypothetical protein
MRKKHRKVRYHNSNKMHPSEHGTRTSYGPFAALSWSLNFANAWYVPVIFLGADKERQVLYSCCGSVGFKFVSPTFQCYYTFAGSQRNFLMHLGYSASNATSLNAAFSILWIMGSPRYARKPPGGNSLMGLCYYIFGSAKQSKKGLISLTGWIVLLAFLVLSVVQAFVTDVSIKHALSWVALALAFYSCAVLCICHMRNDHLNGLEDHPAGLLSVAEARDMLDTVPIIIVINCGFMIAYKYVLVPRQARWDCSVPVLTLYLHCRALT